MGVMELLIAFCLGAGAVLAARRLLGARRAEDDLVLERLEAAVNGLVTQQTGAAGRLEGMLSTVVEVSGRAAGETSQLAQALRRPGVRGRWGETTLRNLVEAAGLAEHIDFDVQAHLAGSGEDPARRPDLVVRMPGGGCVPVDAKVPLDAYLDACEAESEEAREAALDRHVACVRTAMRDLAAKAYWRSFARAPEMVVMFVASEAAFAAAAHRDPGLLGDAARHRVAIATPATMLALAQVVALGWREAALSENAERVREVATELVRRMGVLGGHLDRVGRSLDQAARAHNEAVGSYEQRLLVTARRLGDLGIAEGERLEGPQGVEHQVRLPADRGEAAGARVAAA